MGGLGEGVTGVWHSYSRVKKTGLMTDRRDGRTGQEQRTIGYSVISIKSVKNSDLYELLLFKCKPCKLWSQMAVYSYRSCMIIFVFV